MTKHDESYRPGRRIASLNEALDVYVTGQAGIRFEALMRFAGPLFDLYDVEWKSVGDRTASARDEDELTTMVAVLDAARLLWSFFSLDDEQSIGSLPELEDALLGRGAGDEERSNLLVLLSLLEEHWQSFSPSERADAVDTPGYTLPDFEALIVDYESRKSPLPRAGRPTFGPDALELPDALAAFAEPLLRDPAIESSPDLVEERVERAQAYWDLATTPVEEYEDHLRRIVDTFAGDEQDRTAIRDEAERMVARFKNLFSDRPGSP